MKIEDLLKMDAGEALSWLVENSDKFTLQPKPIVVDSPEDVEIKGEEFLVWDGCEWVIDYIESCPETGEDYMANGSNVEAYLPLPERLS